MADDAAPCNSPTHLDFANGLKQSGEYTHIGIC